jgi:hypothetical protein
MIPTQNPILLPDEVYECRILGTCHGTISGYFDAAEKIYAAAAAWDGKAMGIYATLNPVNPALLARATNRLIPRAKVTTSDTDILRREWLLIDCDPVRPAGISATDAVHATAIRRAESIAAWLAEQDFPDPVLADSGNGTHLLYRVALANTSESTQLVKTILEVVALRFDDAVVKIDTSVFNAARLTKLYGTIAAKGDSTVERPHRRSGMLQEQPR